jgi:acyl carrier protein
MSEYTEHDIQAIKEMLYHLLTRENIADDDNIYDLGFTSIMALPLLSQIEDTFGLNIPDVDFLDAHTPRALAQMVRRLRGN